MRAELAIDGFAPDGLRVAKPIVHRRERGLDRFEIGLLTAFSVISLWVLALDAFQVVVHNRVWTGTDGVYIVDQMQYLAWIKDAARHIFAANLFVLRPTPADYFQPAVAISGVLSALGLPPTLALLLWKPVAVGGLFVALRAFIYRTVAGVWPRRAALTLALFFASATVAYGSFTVLGDLFPGFLSWGYTFGLLSIAAMVGAIVFYDRDRSRGRVGPWPAVLGAVCSLLHPWHGEVLAVVIFLAEVSMWRAGARGRRLAPAVALAGIGLALIYYWLLGDSDLSWKLARDASKHSFSIWPIAIYLAPLAIPAALGYRGRARTFMVAATRAWPIGALAIFVLSSTVLGATPLHAFEGITIPLAPLAVLGITGLGGGRAPRGLRGVAGAAARRLSPPRGRLLGIAVIALATVPGTVLQLNSARQLAAPTLDNANFIAVDEKAALDYLARERAPGGVITRSYLGAVVPSRTGRHVLVGDCIWSEPGCLVRTGIAQQLFDGTLPKGVARRFVRRTGARFVLADCKAHADLARVLAPMLDSVTRFGCAAVYEVDPTGPPYRPLANLRGDASVRAARR